MRGTAYHAAERVARWLASAGVFFLLGAMLVTMSDVVLRLVARMSAYFFDAPLNLIVPGIVDITQLLVIAVAYLAMPYAFLTGSHVSVDLVTDRFPPRLLAVVRAGGALLSLCFMAAVTWYGAQAALQQYGYGDASHTIAIPILWYWTPLLIGAALSVVATALLIAGYLARAFEENAMKRGRPCRRR